MDGYWRDLLEWPGHWGAPFEDVNQNGQWDSGVDQPGYACADQVIWFGMNDAAGGASSYLFG